jgi:hypothetical protein
MKSVRVTTLEVNEGEGMRGSSHFSRLTDRRAHIPDSGAERPRCPLSAHGSRPRCPVRFANRSRIIRTKSASGHSAAV